MHYIYGPIQSRRLGVSLGVSMTPYKYCTLDCVYCQLRRTSNATLERKEYVKVRSVLAELERFLKKHPEDQKIDYITISGSGEPLLHSRIKEVIKGIKGLCSVPVALITNATLLAYRDVRRDVLDADLIVPSLDAYTQDVFEKIDRPRTSSIAVSSVIEGLVALRKEFTNLLWLEIMMIKGMNDDLTYMQGFKEVIDRIQPDKIHLNVPSRPPSELWAKPPSLERLKKIQQMLGPQCEIA